MRAPMAERLVTFVGQRPPGAFLRRISRRFRNPGQASVGRWRSRMATAHSNMTGVEAGLHEAAVRAARWHDFGVANYREGLGRLLGAIETSEYTAQQQERIRQSMVVPALRGRLYSERGWHERPKSLNAPVPAPIAVCGLPRTGTTALQKVLSMDSRFQGLNGWLVLYPMPRPPRDRWSSIPEYRAVEASIRPSAAVKAAHLRTADEVDEPLELMNQSFSTNTFAALFHLPSYDEWFRAQDQRPVYRRLADNLRLIGSNEPEKPWLLQNPGNILALDALLDVFPDAKILWTHRDPGDTLASMSSLFGGVRRTLLREDVPIDDIPKREVGLWSQAVRKALVVRDRFPASFHDVDFRSFVADPMGVVRGIYDRFDMELDPATELAMLDWIKANPQGKHGVHAYNREEFGLSHDLIGQEFGSYMQRFGLA
jgi:hypothetical protein